MPSLPLISLLRLVRLPLWSVRGGNQKTEGLVLRRAVDGRLVEGVRQPDGPVLKGGLQVVPSEHFSPVAVALPVALPVTPLRTCVGAASGKVKLN